MPDRMMDRHTASNRRQFLAGVFSVGVAGSLLSTVSWARAQQHLAKYEGALFSDGERHTVELAHDDDDHIVVLRIDDTNYWANGRRTPAGRPLRSTRITRVRDKALEVYSASGRSIVPIHRQTLLKYYFYIEEPTRRVIELSCYRGVYQLSVDGRAVL